MYSINFKCPRSDLPQELQKMSSQQIIRQHTFLPTLKRRSSIDLASVEPKHIRLVSAKDENRAKEEEEKEEDAEEEDAILVEIKSEPVLRPMKQVSSPVASI